MLLHIPFPLPGLLPSCVTRDAPSVLSQGLAHQSCPWGGLSQLPLPFLFWPGSLLLALCLQTQLYTYQSELLLCLMIRCRFLHGQWLSDSQCLDQCPHTGKPEKFMSKRSRQCMCWVGAGVQVYSVDLGWVLSLQRLCSALEWLSGSSLSWKEADAHALWPSVCCLGISVPAN